MATRNELGRESAALAITTSAIDRALVALSGGETAKAVVALTDGKAKVRRLQTPKRRTTQ